MAMHVSLYNQLTLQFALYYTLMITRWAGIVRVSLSANNFKASKAQGYGTLI